MDKTAQSGTHLPTKGDLFEVMLVTGGVKVLVCGVVIHVEYTHDAVTGKLRIYTRMLSDRFKNTSEIFEGSPSLGWEGVDLNGFTFLYNAGGEDEYV